MTTVIDEEVFETARKVFLPEVIDFLGGDAKARMQQRQKFVAGEVENPTLDYPKLNVPELLMVRDAVDALDLRVQRSGMPGFAKAAYFARITERQRSIQMLLAAARGDMANFAFHARAVYGEPQKLLVRQAVQAVRAKAEAVIRQPDERKRVAAMSLLSAWPSVQEVPVLAPPAENFVQVVRRHVERLFPLQGLVPEQGEFGSEGIRAAFVDLFARMQLNWQVRIENNGTAITAKQATKTLEIPVTRTVSADKLRGLLVHEGMHVLRRERGEKTGLLLLGLGLADYESGEEGVTTMFEHAVKGGVFKDYPGRTYCLAIGFATGLVDGVERDFRGVYRMLLELFRFQDAMREEDDDDTPSRKKPEERAWNACVRVFRGTTCAVKGVVFPKDMAYRQSGVAMWHFLEDHPEEFSRLAIGKFNPLREDHRKLLDALGHRLPDGVQMQETSPAHF